MSEFIDQKFDYATIAFVLHELSKDDRDSVINEMRDIAKKLIIVDYTIPLPKTFWGILTILVKLLEGIGNFRNFQPYNTLGGVYGLLKEIGLKIEKEKIDKIKLLKL